MADTILPKLSGESTGRGSGTIMERLDVVDYSDQRIRYRKGIPGLVQQDYRTRIATNTGLTHGVG